MSDSLVVAGIIELLGGGVASTHPQALGAIFRLGTDWDLSAPQMTSEQTAGLLLDGEVVTGWRASNRTPTLPVTILVPTTGDIEADRLTLAGARELLLQLASQDNWELTWTREGGQALILDCMGLSSTTIHYSVLQAAALVSQVDITFAAFPYGRSDTQETLQFNSPGQLFPPPPATVTIDDLTNEGSNFLTGDDAGFEVTAGHWVGAGNCAVVRTTAQHHSGVGSLQLTSTAAGSMQAASALATLLLDAPGVAGLGLEVNPGDTVTGKAWFRAAVSARSCNVGIDFYDSTGTQVGATLRGSNVTDSTSAFVQATCAVTAPQGAVVARLNSQVVSTGAGGEVHDVDDPYLDRGPVYSADDSYQWSSSAVTPVSGARSARWTRSWRDFPVYDHTLPAAVDITGRTKWAFWFGLGTTSSQWPVWHRGRVAFAVTLYDAAGESLSFGFKRTCHASAIETKPHWQYASCHIPQVASGFDYTTVSRYVIEAWNYWDSAKVNPISGRLGQPVLQAGAFIGLVQAVPSTTGVAGTRALWATLPGIVGSARAAVAVQVAPGPSAFSTVAEFTTAGSNNWTAPSGVTHVDKAECWGGGGGGAGGDSTPFGGGGGGAGEYSVEYNLPVTALSTYHPFVGAAGTGGAVATQGNNAGDSTFAGDSGATVRAHGGKGGWHSQTWGGGKGGTGSTNYGHSDGGNGRQSNVNGEDQGRGGGGGSSGGPSAGGHDATGRPGSAAVYDGGPGGDGGFEFISPGAGTQPSVGPGGGGGGGACQDSGARFAGAAGRNGKVRLSYGASGLLPLQSFLAHMPTRGAPDALNPVCPVGNGADTPNGATEYLVPAVGALNARYDGTYTLMLVVSTWSSPASSHTLTVQLRQYPYSGGTAATQNVVRTLTPSTDLTGTLQYVDMGPVTLPLQDLPPGNLDAYFAATVLSSITADRFLDIVLIDTQGSLVLVDVGGTSIFNNMWIDQPDASRALGRLLGSDADRDRAFSVSQYATRVSGPPLSVYPDENNRMLLYSAQGVPSAQGFYPPQWWAERLS